MRKTQKFEVLYPISPEQGPIIHPAPAPTADNPAPEPVLVGVEIFNTDDMADVERRATILIAQGHLRLHEPPEKGDKEPTTTTKDNPKE